MSFSGTQSSVNADNISLAIRGELARRDMTQRELAGLLCMSQQALSRRLRGDVPFTAAEVARIARTLNVGIEALYRDPAA